MPARYVVAPGGMIEYADISVDYTRRGDPSELIPVLAHLAAAFQRLQKACSYVQANRPDHSNVCLQVASMRHDYGVPQHPLPEPEQLHTHVPHVLRQRPLGIPCQRVARLVRQRHADRRRDLGIRCSLTPAYTPREHRRRRARPQRGTLDAPRTPAPRAAMGRFETSSCSGVVHHDHHGSAFALGRGDAAELTGGVRRSCGGAS
jgi:hypothetical protein